MQDKVVSLLQPKESKVQEDVTTDDLEKAMRTVYARRVAANKQGHKNDITRAQ